MNLHEALDAAYKGNFVTNQYFSYDQSLHYYDGKYYYEDGAVVTAEYLETQRFATHGEWSIVIPKNKVNFKKLKTMHKNSGELMLRKGSYMDCRKGEEV